MASFLRHIAQGLGEAFGLERSKRITIWSGPSNTRICSYNPDCVALAQYLKQMGISSIVSTELASSPTQDVQIGFEYYGFKDGLKKLMKIQRSSYENNIDRCIKFLDTFRWQASSRNDIYNLHRKNLTTLQIDQLLEKAHESNGQEFPIPGIDQSLANVNNQLMIFEENLIGSTFLDGEFSPSIDDFRLFGIVESLLYGSGGMADSLLSHFGSLITHDVDVASFGRIYSVAIKNGSSDGEVRIGPLSKATSDSGSESEGGK